MSLNSHWAQKTRFKKPENGNLIGVWRVIGIGVDGVYMVCWLHLFQLPDKTFRFIEHSTNDTYVEGQLIDPECYDYYSAEEIKEIESDYSYPDSSMEMSSNELDSFTNIAEAASFSVAWMYDKAKEDGGHSFYYTRELTRRMPL